MSGSTFTHTDVTAVKISNSFIYAGIGSYMSVHERCSGYFLQRIECLNGQKIHGIVQNSDGNTVVVYGGKQFNVLENTARDLRNGLPSTDRPTVTMCNDWIHSVAWMGPSCAALAILTAHNVVQIWELKQTHYTLRHMYPGKDNSILYSGLLVNLDRNDALVLAGTVYSEVIIRLYRGGEALHRLKGHKGVIFSVTCDLDKEIIVTTSDDRSVRIWGRNNVLSSSSKFAEYWREVEIVCKHELYGHTARVMRSTIIDNYVVSVGEDSRVCFWDSNGELHQKLTSHQNGGIWSIDASGDCLVTGGGDGAVYAHPIGLSPNSHKSKPLNIDVGKPKQIAFSALHNLFILNENDEFFHYNFETEALTRHELKNESACYLLSTSSCKQMCAVTGRRTINMFVEVSEENDSLAHSTLFFILKVHKNIYSTQWAGEKYLVMSTEEGLLTVLVVSDSTVSTHTTFLLPPCKERWVTCAGVDVSEHVFVVGDRCGGIHLFRKGAQPPVRTFHKLHGRYGPNSLMIKNNVVITTGRDRTIKYFKINHGDITHTATKELDFHWVEKFVDREENVVCGFKEKMFVVFNLRKNSRILEVECGGGHRSWDAIKYFDRIDGEYEEFVIFAYLKNCKVNYAKYQVSNVFAKNIVYGWHSAAVNCLVSCQFDRPSRLVFSGGEDTTLRVSALTDGDVYECHVVCKQLSSVRALKLYAHDNGNYVVLSAGGRGQLCVRAVTVRDLDDSILVNTEDMVDFVLKGRDKERRGREANLDLDPETRIMDIDYVKHRHRFTIFAGCSDAYLRVFVFRHDRRSFRMIKQTKYHTACILKTVCVKYQESDILLTCSTRGEVAFWNTRHVTEDVFEPFFVMMTNKSGINSVVCRAFADMVLVVTGGDDGDIHLKLVRPPDPLRPLELTLVHGLVLDRCHSSAVTGLCLVGDVLLSASIDQRVTLFKWSVTDRIECTYSQQLLTDIADVHGMELIDIDRWSVSVCVFGKGMEVLKFECDCEP